VKARPLAPPLLAALAFLPACAPPPPLPPPAGEGPRLTLRVVDHLAWPFRLSRLVVAADGAVVYRRAFLDDRAPPAQDTALAVAPGEHTVQILAETRVQVTPAGPECGMTLRLARSFVAAEGAPVALTADLHVRDRQRPFAEQLRARLEVRGASPDPWLGGHGRSADDARCAALPAPDAAMCRVEGNVAAAQRERDLIKLFCNQDKLDQMRALARVRDEAKARLAGEQTIEPEREARRARRAEARIVALGAEADQCVGEDLAYLPATSVVADEACFAANAPDREPDRPYGGL
jgi:hypothetical protein